MTFGKCLIRRDSNQICILLYIKVFLNSMISGDTSRDTCSGVVTAWRTRTYHKGTQRDRVWHPQGFGAWMKRLWFSCDDSSHHSRFASQTSLFEMIF